jgi:hypothetical protein
VYLEEVLHSNVCRTMLYMFQQSVVATLFHPNIAHGKNLAINFIE